jgi:putative thioredoxin
MNFQKDVIDRSHQIPVVVDFWAPWCGPCRVLGPVIEQLANENKSTWELVKLNTEEEQEIATQYQIRGIPNVKLFIDGKVVNEFAGNLPRQQIIQWLDKNIPSREKSDWAALSAKIENAAEADAIASLTAFVTEHPTHKEARLSLARLVVFSNPDKAHELMATIKMGEPGFDMVEDISSLKELVEISAPLADSLESDLVLAASDIKSGAFESGIERIIEVVRKDKSIANELPRRAAVALFRLLGSQHPVTKKYRRIFDMALY